MSSGSGPLFVGPDVAGWQTVAEVAQPTPTPSNDDKGGQGEDFGKSSPVGLLVLLLFFIAVAFLVRSMTKHLKRVPASFDDPDEKADQPTEEAPSADADKK
ncbi:hypothetical protein [Actinophytocola oryzae]|uniref:Uncharacterized protein n=1 Tax=Actinophytocola oryzae TaxID=502181 RepID=A0A4R7VD26_9PSEU|nr:hypothetical protein [Actinophytocola oryzae]TDV47036.1 hypothetical protein CLV71_110219 [Actinophytocola oryzae]